MQKRTNAGKPAGKKPDRRGLFGLFAKKKDIPTTAQQTLPYREMYRDGVCRVADRYYTKTIEYEDINRSGTDQTVTGCRKNERRKNGCEKRKIRKLSQIPGTKK